MDTRFRVREGLEQRTLLLEDDEARKLESKRVLVEEFELSNFGMCNRLRHY